MVKWKSLKWLVQLTRPQHEGHDGSRSVWSGSYGRPETRDDLSIPSSLRRQAPPKPPRSGQVFVVRLLCPERRGDLGIHLGKLLLLIIVYILGS